MLHHDLLPRCRNLKAKNINQVHVRKVLDAIVQRGSPIAANRTLALVRKIFNFAGARGLAQFNARQGIERPARETPRDRVLNRSPAYFRRSASAI